MSYDPQLGPDEDDTPELFACWECEGSFESLATKQLCHGCYEDWTVDEPCAARERVG